MTLSAVRVAMARENIDEAPLTPEEQLMVAPPDAAAQDPDVALATQEDAQAVGSDDVVQLLDDGAAVSDVIETVKAEGADVTPETVMIAQERLNTINRRYGFAARKISRENFEAAGPFSEAQDLIADAEKNLEYIKVAANEGLKELGQRMAVNVKNFFRWRTTYLKDVRAVAQAAKQVAGAPSSTARYTNKVRIAHFMDANQNILSTAAQLQSAFATSIRAMQACRTLQEQFERVFVFFSQGNGNVDLDSLGSAFDQVETQHGTGYSMAGKAGIFGEDIILQGLNLTGNTTTQEGLLSAFSTVKYKHVWHWTVSELGDVSLPVMSAQEVAKNAQALESLAKDIKTGYDILDSLADMYNGSEKSIGSMMLEAISNPKLYFKFRNVVAAGIAYMHQAGDMNIDLKAKALNCVLDYYKWSLKNHEYHTSAATEALEPAAEGFTGGLMGFLGGNALGPIWGALSHGRGGQLRRQIKQVAEQIEDMKQGEVEAALKNGKVSQQDYDKIIKMDWEDIVAGAIGGGVLWGIFGAFTGSRMQDAHQELEEKIKELNALIRQEEAAQKRRAAAT